MTAPWIEVEKYPDRDTPLMPSHSEYAWQALFACQVQVLPHPEWVKLKWGFNAMALFDEALDRQRLFLESRYAIANELGVEPPDQRTLAFRFINQPGKGLSVVLVGKVQARTQPEALENAELYCAELKSTLPYDYTLLPALSRQEYLEVSGMELLDEKQPQMEIAQIQRVEIPVAMERGASFVQGFWRSTPHAHEQVWRALGASSHPAMLNISLRSTYLYEKERERLVKIKKLSDEQRTGSAVETWNKDYLERRLTLWKKFFYLQIHALAPRKVCESLCQVIGTAITLSGEGKSHPGFRIICPGPEDGRAWRKKLKNLDPVFTASPLPVPRLSEVADLDEVFAVMRLPYSPPENGFRDVNFIARQE